MQALCLRNGTAPGVGCVLVRYFTAWALLLHALVVVDTRPLGAFVSLVGGYITYVHPRRLGIPIGPGVTLTGRSLYLVDLLFHHLPFAFALWCPGIRLGIGGARRPVAATTPPGLRGGRPVFFASTSPCFRG